MNCSVNPNRRIRKEFIPGQFVVMVIDNLVGLIIAKYKDPRWQDELYTYLIMWVNPNGTMEYIETWKPESWIARVIE